jgi:RNA polymerase sigma factor (sigma-70 family)
MNRQGNDSVVATTVGDATTIEASLRDPERFAVIFDRHAPQIHRYLARRLGRDIADDLTAETFLAAFRRRHRYDLDRTDARPWLYGIATNLVGQHRREEAREYQLRQAVVRDRDPDCHADQVVADVTAQAVRPMLLAALANLSQADRDVLVLIGWEELTYDEVARALAIPVGTVRSRLNRARKKVREALASTDHVTFEEALS